jgi:hypothetical protein
MRPKLTKYANRASQAFCSDVVDGMPIIAAIAALRHAALAR